MGTAPVLHGFGFPAEFILWAVRWYLAPPERPGPGAEFDLSTSTQWNPGQ